MVGMTDEMVNASIDDLEADLHVGELIEFANKISEVPLSDLLLLFAGYGTVIASGVMDEVSFNHINDHMDAIYLEIQLRTAVSVV